MNTKLPEPSRLSRHSRGFTLIELMVTVLIVSILAAIAYPSYRNYVIRGQLVDATQGLSTMRANMERYFQDNRTYAAVGTFTPPCATSTVVGTFTLTCTGTGAPTATTFIISAQGTTGALSGFVFTVDQNDNQATTVGSPAPSAFSSCTTAWVTKAGGC